ncbi:hypothetical protein C0581_03525 [Candidatus Parcubacteria bacterium]|nr:MAG: hypothetical protein C0581_03525 [Candidatus Parcubacteria bacterium]
MPTPHFEKTSKSLKLKMNLIWGIFLIAPIFYMGVLYKITMTGTELSSTPPNNAFVSTLVIISIVIGMLSFFFPDFLVKKMTSQIKLQNHHPNQPLDKMDEKEREDMRLITAYFVSFLLKNAMAESIAIYGLVLGVMTDDLKLFLYFAVPSILLLIIHRPNIEQATNRTF